MLLDPQNAEALAGELQASLDQSQVPPRED